MFLKTLISIVLLCALHLPAFTAGEPIRIVFLGDSLTEGYGVEEPYNFPSGIGARLKKDGYTVKIINAGSSGSTSASGLGRLKWLMKHNPDILFLALGANDGLRGLRVKSMKKNLTDTIRYALSKDIRVILAGMHVPPNYGKKYAMEFHQVFIDIATEFSISLVPFLLKDVAGIKKLNLRDGIHPNENGYKIVVDTVLPYIKKNL